MCYYYNGESMIKEFKKVIKKYPLEYIYKLVISIILRGLLLLTPVIFSNAINEITKKEYDKAIYLILISIGVTVLYRLFEVINQFSYYKLYTKLYNSYYDNSVKATNNNSIFSLSRFTIGEYSNILIDDANVVSTFFSNIVIRIVQILEFIFIYYYFYILNPYFFLFVIAFSLIIFLMSLKTSRRIQTLNHKIKLSLDSLVSHTNEYFRGIKEIKSFNIFNKIFDKTSSKMKDYMGAVKKYHTRSASLNNTYLLLWEVVRLLSVLYGVFLVKEGSIEIGVLLIIYNYYQKIIDNFSMVLSINIDYRVVNVSLSRINKILEYSRSKESKDKIDVEIKGNIKFDKVLYGYRENPILNNVSFDIKENKINILKSKQTGTKAGVFDLLLKLNKQHEGSITIDSIDINAIDDNTYFNLLSITREEPFFFDMSIKNNLLLISNDIDRVLEVSKKIGLEECLESFEQGYDTKLNNSNMNSIIKQMISITRIFIKDSKIMMFDEGIDLLDDKNRKKVLNLLKEESKNHTIIISTHDSDIENIGDNIINLD